MKYRKKPVVIEAMQYTGNNRREIYEFTNNMAVSNTCESRLTIFTLEGNMSCEANDWIIKGVIGEFYPCKQDVFEMTYEAVIEDMDCADCKYQQSTLCFGCCDDEQKINYHEYFKIKENV